MDVSSSYRILGCSPYNSTENLKRSYRQLALKTHPDLNKSVDAAEKFRQITEALEFLLKNHIQQPRPKEAYQPKPDAEKFYRIVNSTQSVVRLPQKRLDKDAVVYIMYRDNEYRVSFPAGTELPKQVKIPGGVVIVDGPFDKYV